MNLDGLKKCIMVAKKTEVEIGLFEARVLRMWRLKVPYYTYTPVV